MIADDLMARGRMPLVLAGWDSYSVWGWDQAEGALFAQLWMNSDNFRDEPRVWITPGLWPTTRDVAELAQFIARATGCSDHDARQAMARCAPASVKDALLGAAV